jgi:hypothetical protein
MKKLLLNRRNVLIGATSIASAYFFHKSKPNNTPQQDSITLLIDKLPNKKSCVALGELYFNAYQSKIDFLQEYEKLTTDLNGTSRQNISSAFRNMVKNDFEARNIVNLEGLILAKSEAYLYSLSYLKQVGYL